jgi:hypothetical protein
MTFLAYALMAAASSGAGADRPVLDRPSLNGTVFAQMAIQQRVVIRVPLAPVDMPMPTAPIRMKEARGPKCIAINRLAGASVMGPQTIDLFVRGAPSVRARLRNECRGVDLRYGFYLKPTKDGRVCGGRDSVHARTGGECAIERFRALVPQR